MIQKLLLLALAGALGTLARYGLTMFVHRFENLSFPWGTLVVNVVGCFVAGLVWTLFESKWPVSAETRTVVLVGFMGAFTTFSAFILETGELVRSSEWLFTAANIAGQTGLGFVALIAGVGIARWI